MEDTICGYKIHRFVKLFPSMTEEEYQDLKEDIKLNGQIEPVLINSNNEILDGFHRSKCVSELGLNLKTTLYKGTEKDYLNIVISKNIKRRMLTTNQRSLLGVKLLDLYKNDAELRRLNNLKQNQQTPNATRVSLGRSSEQAGKLVGVSHKSIERAAKVLENGTDKLIDLVETNQLNLTDAYDISKFNKDRQDKILESKSKEEIKEKLTDHQILNKASWLNSTRASENAKKHAQDRKAAKNINNAVGKYSTIILDPPWDIGSGSSLNRSGETPYTTMSLNEIKSKKDKVNKLANDDCWLFLWSPISFLPAALEVVNLFGFTYKFNIVWLKKREKGGTCGVKPTAYPRYVHEHLLVGKKGKIEFDDVLNFDTVINGLRREHSRKPQEVYQIINRVCPKPIIDLYSREDWKKSGLNIDSWGLETDKF